MACHVSYRIAAGSNRVEGAEDTNNRRAEEYGGDCGHVGCGTSDFCGSVNAEICGVIASKSPRSRSRTKSPKLNGAGRGGSDDGVSIGGPLPQACSGPAAIMDERFLHPLQRPEHVHLGLDCRPWHDPKAFFWCAELERHFEVIRSELQAVGECQDAWPLVKGQFGLTGGRGEWRELVMLGEGSELGRRLCPRTAALLDTVIVAKNLAESCGSCGNAIFSRLAPRTRLQPHCGPTNTRLTCHMGIDVPAEGCGMRVGGEARCWREGECIVFDDSWEHEVWNESTRSRVVLLVNFWHPDLPPSLWEEIGAELRDGFL
eukprot:TRINITY_DN32315_c0_g1_i2.p1 TRINITY_DN32315_c0_g1~~TRINITY_DN32315_c0_g1_i2.p1  ORF type:complete len:316 (+),score=45.84 TRINITY_DN32315_c0_g1_i2:104-1051(+)